MNLSKNETLLAPRLKEGDTIGIVAPASHFVREKFNKGLAVLESMGFRTQITDDLFARKDYLAGSDEQRADLLNQAFADQKIKGIICARGGYGSLRILNLLDFEVIRKNPKVFVGFSDITAILWALYARCGLVTFHGPTVTGLGNSTLETTAALAQSLKTAERLEIRSKEGITLKEGQANGPIVGGNLTTLCHLLGTPFAPRFNGHILLLEDRGEAVYRIDRMLTQMKLAGCFGRLAGIILGEFRECGPKEDIYKLVQNIFDDTDMPIVAGFDIGHCEPNTTIPLGLEATLDTNRSRILFRKPATRPRK